MINRKYSKVELEDLLIGIHCLICEAFISNESHQYYSKNYGSLNFQQMKEAILLECMNQNIEPDDDTLIAEIIKENVVGFVSIN